MAERKNISSQQSMETIDFEKLRIIFRKNLIWVLIIVITTNLAAYLYLRYTKNIYEAESELKLDTKQEATDFGLKTLSQTQNVNALSGEVEQITSSHFLNRVLDSLDLWVSYHSIGKILIDEMYHASPFKVNFSTMEHRYLNAPIYFNFTDGDSYLIRIDEKPYQGKIGQPLHLDGLDLVVTKTSFYDLYHDGDYFFILHSREDLLHFLEGSVDVQVWNWEANTIKVAFRDYNAAKASDVVNKIDSIYLFYSYEQKNRTNKQKIDWLNSELSQIENKMEGYENYFENFTLQNKSNNLDNELQKTINSLYAIDSQRFTLTRRIADINTTLDQFSHNDYSFTLGHRLALPESVSKKAEDLQNLVREKEKLGLSYNETTFAFRQKEKQLEALRNQVFQQFNDMKNEWQKGLVELNQRKEKLERQFAAMPDKNTQFTKNQRFYKLYEEFYLSMMQSKAGFEIAQAGSTPDIKILSSAGVPSTPITPKRLMIHGIGLSSGFVMALLFIGLLYLANNKITSVQEIEKMATAPLLGVIPESRHTTKSPFHVLDNPKSIVSEAIRTLRTNLDFFSGSGKSKTIAISSTIGGEGKSFLALNLGGVIAMSKRKVVLVDLDMRKPKQNIPFDIKDPQKGVSTALIRKYDLDECIIPTGLENFDYIPSGPHPPNPSELLTNGDFTAIMDRLKEKYEFVIVDTPPVGLVTDGIMAMRKTDMTIYVIRANYSKKDFLDNVERIQSLHKLNNLSIVFNALPSSDRMYGYGYYEDQTPVKRRWQYFLRG